jgi:hypothetical protein
MYLEWRTGIVSRPEYQRKALGDVQRAGDKVVREPDPVSSSPTHSQYLSSCENPNDISYHNAMLSRRTVGR